MTTYLFRGLAFLTAVFITSVTISAQCSLENFSVTVSDCQGDNSVNVIIDFDTDSPSSIGYQVITTTGFTVVQIDEFPYTISLDGNCVTDYNVGIKDLSVADCEVSENIGVICCTNTCELNFNVEDIQCEEDQSITAQMSVTVAGSSADSFDLYTNNEFFERQSFFEFLTLELDFNEPVLNLAVCVANTMCCDTMDIVNPCSCNITDIHAAVLDCDDDLENYYLRVDFDSTLPSSDSFNIGRPGNALGTHAYADLPVRVGPISMDEDDNDIFILDQTDAFCFGFIPHITLDSCDAISCQFTDLEVDAVIDCDDSGDATFTLSFNTSVESQGFLVDIDGQSFGPFAYGLSEYSIGPLPADGVSASTVIVTDLDDPDCVLGVEVAPVFCDCDISNIDIIQFCNEDVLTSVLLDFDASGSISDSFDIVSSVSTDRHAYTDLPINIFGLPTADISLEVFDANNGSCSLLIMQPLECVLECEISNFEVELLSCEGLGFANLTFNFDFDDLTTDTIVLSYNGNALGNYIVQDTGNYVIPFLEVDCELDFNSFSIAPINDPDCIAEFAMPNIDCCTPCMIDSTETIVTCLDNFSIAVLLDFDYDGEPTDAFDLVIDNALFGTFNYDQIPISISLDAVEQGEIPFTVEFEDCILNDIIAYDCTEECIVENIQLDTLTCDNGMFTAAINFDHSESNDSFLLLVNDISDNTYALDDLPIEIGPLEGDGVTEYTFIISVVGIESCIGTFELGTLDCGPNSIEDYIINNITWSTLSDGILLNGIAPFQRISLINLQGRVIHQNTITSDQLFIENRDLMHGLYFIRLQDKEGDVHTFKVIL